MLLWHVQTLVRADRVANGIESKESDEHMGLRAAEAVPEDRIDAFIARWTASSAAERANFQSFATELCDVLGVDRPEPATADPTRDRFRFEYPVRFPHPDGSTSTGSIDLYRRGAFVMEAKQGSDQQFEEQLQLFGGTQAQTRKGTAVRGTPNWTAAMQRARGQAERYAKALPVEHGWRPFLIIVDVARRHGRDAACHDCRRCRQTGRTTLPCCRPRLNAAQGRDELRPPLRG